MFHVECNRFNDVIELSCLLKYLEHHDVPCERSGLVGEQVGDQSELLVDVRRVAPGRRLRSLGVTHLAVPREEHGGGELLHLDAHVHADGDDVRVEDEPDQGSVEAVLEVAVGEVAEVPRVLQLLAAGLAGLEERKRIVVVVVVAVAAVLADVVEI